MNEKRGKKGRETGMDKESGREARRRCWSRREGHRNKDSSPEKCGICGGGWKGVASISSAHCLLLIATCSLAGPQDLCQKLPGSSARKRERYANENDNETGDPCVRNERWLHCGKLNYRRHQRYYDFTKTQNYIIRINCIIAIIQVPFECSY